MGLRPAGRLLALACLASARLRAERSLRLRGGGVIDVLKHRAAKTLELEARRDDVGTALCGGRAAAGAFLLVQPLKHFDLDAEPRGARAYQLFFALHFSSTRPATSRARRRSPSSSSRSSRRAARPRRSARSRPRPARRSGWSCAPGSAGWRN